MSENKLFVIVIVIIHNTSLRYCARLQMALPRTGYVTLHSAQRN